ncbi:MAG: dihydropteroate synthase [Acidimicrobiia bacterium]|nr:dihydropteroate synthase [Acidimicrobiia bacterium]
MGVLNVTPDSFSDGGVNSDTSAAVDRGLAMVADGADIIDVGGESTRPGADPVGVGEELERVVPVVAALAAAGNVVSVDTMKPQVASAAVAAGAEIINDVSGLRSSTMMEVAAATGAGVVIMHMRGEPRTMQADTVYGDVVGDVRQYLADQAASAVAAGIDPNRVAVDPGIGFGKSHLQNLELLNRSSDFISLGFPVLIGASRKGFLGTVLAAAGRETVAAERDAATSATVAAAIIAGAAVIRVHDVARAHEVARTTDAIVRGQFEDEETIGGT